MQSSQDGNGGNGALLPSLMRLRLLGRPGSLLFLGDHLLGFLLPFQLLLDEVELLMPLLPELLSQVLSFEQPAHDEGLVLTEEESLEVALLALQSLPNFVVLVVVALFLVQVFY
jgi:hypothetical protein